MDARVVYILQHVNGYIHAVFTRREYAYAELRKRSNTKEWNIIERMIQD